MRDYIELPEGYREIQKIDLVKNKEEFIVVNVINIIIVVVMFLIGIFIKPRMFGSLMPALVMVFGIWIYVMLHELVHGIFMKKFSGVKPNYGFKVIYAYAGSTAYFCKKHYIIIAMAPVVIWGIVLGIINPFVPSEWFWTVYFIQIINISGAAGDLYVTCLMLKMPEDVLVQDTGTDMTVYSAEQT